MELLTGRRTTSFALGIIAFCPITLLTGCGGGSAGTTTPPASNGTTIQYTVTGPTPTAAAVQVSGGSWAALPLSGSTATFTVPTATSNYAVVVLCPVTSLGFQEEEIYEASASDTVNPSSPCPATAVTTVPISVTYNTSAIAATFSRVIIGGFGSGSFSNTSGTVNAPTGVEDVLLDTYNAATNNAPVGLKIVRGVNITGAPLTIPAMTTSDATGTGGTLLVNGIPSGYTSLSGPVTYNTAGGGTAGGGITLSGPQTLLNGGTTASSSYVSVASADTQSGDSYLIWSIAGNSSNTGAVEAIQSFSTAQNVVLSLPGVLTYSGPTAAAYPTFNASYNGFTITAKTGWFAKLGWTKGSGSYDISVNATNAFLGTSPIAIPNLSSVSGFLTPQTSGGTVNWTLASWTQTLPVFGTANIPVNEMAQYAIAKGSYVEP